MHSSAQSALNGLPMYYSKHKLKIGACNQPSQGLMTSKSNLSTKIDSKPHKSANNKSLQEKTYTIWFVGETQGKLLLQAPRSPPNAMNFSLKRNSKCVGP